MFAHWDFSATGRARVIVITLAGMAASMAVALLAVSYTSQFMTETARELTYASAVGIPIVLSIPVMYWFASKLRELAVAHEELVKIASTDGLTGCLNRSAFVARVGAHLSQLDAVGEPGSLLIVDADHFKAINDRYGHMAGDAALRLIARTIAGAVRATDLVGRVGGEEFAAFLPRTDPPRARQIAERIRAEIAALDFQPAGKRQALSVSVGGTLFVGAARFEDLFNDADTWLYEAKNRGRNTVVFGATESSAQSPRYAING